MCGRQMDTQMDISDFDKKKQKRKEKKKWTNMQFVEYFLLFLIYVRNSFRQMRHSIRW